MKKVDTSPSQYNMGEWILIKHPQEETGGNRKSSRPWHGPYRITGVEKTGIVTEQIYGDVPKSNIRVHLQRVSKWGT